MHIICESGWHREGPVTHTLTSGLHRLCTRVHFTLLPGTISIVIFLKGKAQSMAGLLHIRATRWSHGSYRVSSLTWQAYGFLFCSGSLVYELEHRSGGRRTGKYGKRSKRQLAHRLAPFAARGSVHGSVIQTMCLLDSLMSCLTREIPCLLHIINPSAHVG